MAFKTYSQRFQAIHRYLADFLEDVLAVTVCLPATILLYAFNIVIDQLNDFPFIPARIGTGLWKIAKILIGAPLYFFKGVAECTVIPMFAFFAAFKSWSDNQLDPRYSFPLEKIFLKLIMNPVVGIAFVVVVLTFVGTPSFVWETLFWLSALGFCFLNQTSMLHQLSMIYLTCYQFVAIGIFFYPFMLPFLFAKGVTTTIVAAFTLVTYYEVPVRFFLKFFEKTIPYVQKILRKCGLKPHKNAIEGVTLEPISEISEEDLFVSNSNHAFDISSLEGNCSSQGLRNYYINLDLDFRDVERLDQQLQALQLTSPSKFTVLKDYLRQHRDEYQPQRENIIEESIQMLSNYATALANYNVSFPSFTQINALSETRNALEQHLQGLPAQQRERIETLNLNGGTDPEYQLRRVLTELDRGGFCKRAAASMFHATVDRIRRAQTDQSFDGTFEGSGPFWRRTNPIHWIVNGVG